MKNKLLLIILLLNVTVAISQNQLLNRDSLKPSSKENYQTKEQFQVKKLEPRWGALENEYNESYWKDAKLDRLYIQLKPGSSDCEIQNFLLENKIQKIISRSKYPQSLNYIVVKVPNGNKKLLLSLIKMAKSISQIQFAEPILLRKSQSCLPNDPGYLSQWGPYMIYADSAWCYTTGNPTQKIAVIDNAVDWFHGDLYDNVWYGYDFGDNDYDPTPDYVSQSHGTHVTGIVAATLNNNAGVAGMINDTIYFAKVTSIQDSVSFSTVAIVDALTEIATSHPDIKIINMSFGGYSYSAAEESACQLTWNNGKLLIAASGNDDTAVVMYPAAFFSVIAVGAIGYDGTNLYPAPYTNYGFDQELSAPGGDMSTANSYGILSTFPNNDFEFLEGTSMASPMVTGLAGLVWAANPALKNVDVRTILQQSVFDLGEPGWDPYWGYGMVCAYCAIQNALDFNTNVNEPSKKNQTLFPNPTTGILQFSSEQINEFDIYNSIGEKIFHSSGNLFQIDLSTKPNGIYFLKSKTYSYQFVISK